MASITGTMAKFSVPLASEPKNSPMLMPKLKYRFRVSFIGWDNSDFISQMVSDVKRPSWKMEKQTIDVYNSKINYAGKLSWDPIELTIRDSVKNETMQSLAAQLQRQFDFYEQSSAASSGDYKFDMVIEILDGMNGSNETTVIERWECLGCFIESANYDTLDYKESTPVTIKLSIQPDACHQLIGGTGTERAGGTAVPKTLSDTSGSMVISESV